MKGDGLRTMINIGERVRTVMDNFRTTMNDDGRLVTVKELAVAFLPSLPRFSHVLRDSDDNSNTQKCTKIDHFLSSHSLNSSNINGNS